jgi:hypothetical protein
MNKNSIDQIKIHNIHNEMKSQAVNIILINNFNGHEIKVKTHEIL